MDKPTDNTMKRRRQNRDAQIRFKQRQAELGRKPRQYFLTDAEAERVGQFVDVLRS